MKLFVWNNPYRVSYGGSLLYAVAESEEAAREMIARPTPRYAYGEYAETPLNFLPDLGPPTRVVDVPCAELYEWSE